MLLRGLLDITYRVGGPMTFRTILQPIMAAILAFRAALKDAQTGRPPYLWTIVTNPAQRGDLIREGWKSVARVFFLAVIMDVIYQLIVLGWVYPLELIVIAICLAVVPYLLVRGPMNRLVSRLRGKREAVP